GEVRRLLPRPPARAGAEVLAGGRVRPRCGGGEALPAVSAEQRRLFAVLQDAPAARADNRHACSSWGCGHLPAADCRPGLPSHYEAAAAERKAKSARR